MVKIGLPWLLLVLMKLTNREIRSDEILSLREVFEICQVEPGADVCDWLDRPPSPVGVDLQDGSPEKRRQKTVFSSWGGKRQGAYPSGGKRPAFSSWGGKRSASRAKQSFSSWGGKRAELPPGGGYDDDGAAQPEHQMEKRELRHRAAGVKPQDKKNDGYRNEMTNGIHALFTIFSDWSKNPEAKKGVRYAGLKSIRRSTDFFPWGGKRSEGADSE